MTRSRSQYLTLHLMAALRKLRGMHDKRRLFVGALREFKRKVRRPSMRACCGKLKLK